jgi:hypothetical protein
MKTVATTLNAISHTKRVIFLVAASVLSIGIAAGGAAVPGISPRAQTTASQSTEQAQPTPQAQTTQLEQFKGEVSPDPDTGDGKVRAHAYEIYDENRDSYFFLEGKDAKKPLYDYAGQRVEISGTLDEKSQTIHIESIKSIHW